MRLSVFVIFILVTLSSACGGRPIDKGQDTMIILTEDGMEDDGTPTDVEGTQPDVTQPGDLEMDPETPTPTVGEGVFLYWGSGGGGPDHDPERLGELYREAGLSVTVAESVPADLADQFGVLVLLNPREGLPSSLVDAARDLVARGGRLVSVVDHSGYGGHDVAATVLEAVGSSLRSQADVRSGSVELTLEEVPGLTDGVAEVLPYYAARVDVGAGIALGQASDGYVAIGYETVGIGDVLVVGDASMFGYALDEGDNATFILNFANLR